MQNVIADVIASIVVAVLGFILITFGKLFPLVIGKLTIRLLEDALKVNARNSNPEKEELRTKVIERVQQAGPGVYQGQGNMITEFENQLACESQLIEHFREAKVIKILTIRGSHYFLGHRSLFFDLCELKTGRGYSIELLVLALDAPHLTDEHAKSIGHASSAEVKTVMANMFEYLKVIRRHNRNFVVRFYKEEPIFKILLFDDVMFVSAFVAPKNDRNAKMWRMIREGNPLFAGLERYFDDLSKRSDVLK